MFSPNDILILGDSYASERIDPRSWTSILTSLLTEGKYTTPRGVGHEGGAWWSARKVLLQELEKKIPKVLIFCHTEPMRLPSEQDLPLNAASACNIELHISRHKLAQHDCDYKTIAHAATLYYKHLFIEDYHVWAQKSWFKELDEIIHENQIPYVIHMHCFPPWTDQELYVFTHGITVEEILWDYCIDKYPLEMDRLNIINHFSVEQNETLAHRLYGAINNYSDGCRKLNLE